MIKAGVIGHPIAHSKSPLIHGFWLKRYGIDGVYDRYDIAPDNLHDGVAELVQQGLCGFNVTLPHKQAMMGLCDSVSDVAQKIGAVNTVTISSDGSLYGDNTDAYGFMQNFESVCSGYDFTDKTVMIIGAGGAARGVLYAIEQKNPRHIIVTNRTLDTATNLANGKDINVCTWDNKDTMVAQSHLIINTTSLGMKGQPDLSIDISKCPDDAIVYDIVYNPLYTPLLVAAHALGLTCVTGIGMLLHQAKPGFQKWFGVEPEVTPDLENLILEQ